MHPVFCDEPRRGEPSARIQPDELGAVPARSRGRRFGSWQHARLQGGLAGQRVSGVVCGGHRDDFGVHWVSCLPRGHHGQQARGPCAVPCRAVFPQQMSCAAAFAVV